MSRTRSSSDLSPSTRPLRLGYVVSHPIQYQAPLLRRIAATPGIDLRVLFGSDFSVRDYRDEGFGVDVHWDVPLLDGYDHEFLPALRDTGGLSPTTPVSSHMLRALHDAAGKPRFDALWVHGYASLNSLQAMIAAKALGIPVLLRAESWLADRPRTPAKLWAKTIFFRALSELVDAVLPIGTHNAQYWREYLPDTPQFQMPYAVDNEFFARLAEAARPNLADLRAELNLTPDQPVILFASKLLPRKCADDLIRAFARLHSELPANAPCLVIVGDGEQRADLEALVDATGLRPHVRFAGFRNQSALPAFFALASVFVLPSRHEPWGLIVNEAMAAGCPVIVSDEVGSAADLVDNGVEGFVVPVADTAALCNALAAVFASPHTPQRMGEAAQSRMLTWSFDQDVVGLRAALEHVTRKRAG